ERAAAERGSARLAPSPNFPHARLLRGGAGDPVLAPRFAGCDGGRAATTGTGVSSQILTTGGGRFVEVRSGSRRSVPVTVRATLGCGGVAPRCDDLRASVVRASGGVAAATARKPLGRGPGLPTSHALPPTRSCTEWSGEHLETFLAAAAARTDGGGTAPLHRARVPRLPPVRAARPWLSPPAV